MLSAVASVGDTTEKFWSDKADTITCLHTIKEGYISNDLRYLPMCKAKIPNPLMDTWFVGKATLAKLCEDVKERDADL